MASTIIQFRVDESLKDEATKIYNNLGTDLSSAIRVFLRRSIKENGYPFDMNLKKTKNDEAIKALRSIQSKAKIDGLANMTLEEINAEILAVRKERRK